MSEKLLGLHSKPMPWRILARLPVCECCQSWQHELAA
jgi:hypothetical protein